MGIESVWVRRRWMTLLLAVFLVAWYALQLSILHLFGEDVARWWFYFELPPNAISPGMVFAPISHRLDTLTHIGGNLLFLFVAGGIAEPYIGKNRVFLLVIGFGYVGIYLANVTAVIHQLWMFAGASGGILSLWAYAGLRMRNHAAESLSDGIAWSRHSVVTGGSVLLLIGIPAFFLHQLVWIDQPHSGHLIGLLLGVLYYCGESYINETEIDLPGFTHYRQ